ncbi:aldo/keto reductase [bacterium]|nr:aldo/keto reductase [bacterium]
MGDDSRSKRRDDTPTRRGFLGRVGQTAAAATAGGLLAHPARAADEPAEARQEGRVRTRVLGKTGLRVSEIGFGGHSWAYSRVPDGKGGLRKVNIDEAVEIIRAGMQMGVNFVDSCTPLVESSTPGEALKRLKARDRFIISIRVSHKMKGVKADQEEIYKWTEERLRLWHTDYVDLCLLCNTENDTPESGYWDMSYAIDALEKLKKQGKIRFTGFGCHFTPELFLKAFDKFGDYFDICSLPYNVRHRAAEGILPAAKKKNLGVITIKPFARGSLLKKRDLAVGAARDMVAFVLENEHVDICTCGLHTLEQMRENFSASWTPLTPAARERLGVAAATPCPGYEWLERDWRYA